MLNLTKKQHIIPVVSIKRFYNEENQILLKNLVSKHKKTTCANARNEVFILKNLWSQKTEKLIMKSYEDKFQKLVDKIEHNNINSFTKQENETILDMYSLWEARIFYKKIYHNKKLENYNLHNIPSSNLTQEQKSILEKKGICYIEEENNFPLKFY
jgi:hypothetical protein